MLPVRKCGSQGFECAAQGLGCMSMSAFYKGYEDADAQTEALRVLAKATKIPGMLLDSSDFYGPHRNEQLIGRAVASKSQNVRIGTKCGLVANPNLPGGIELNSSPEYIKQACQNSLDRLEVKCIDLYYLQRYDVKTPIEDVMRAFKELVQEGKIKYVGVSELSIENLRRAHAVHPITAYQLEWSLFTRDAEQELIPTCRELGIGIVVYSPLGRGLITGAITKPDDIPQGDVRLSIPRFTKHLDANLQLLDVVRKIALEKNCTMGQVALAWVHAQGEDVFPIPGTKTLSRFEENIAAFEIQLTATDMSRLEPIADQVQGGRTSAAFKNFSYTCQQTDPSKRHKSN